MKENQPHQFQIGQRAYCEKPNAPDSRREGTIQAIYLDESLPDMRLYWITIVDFANNKYIVPSEWVGLLPDASQEI